MSQSAASNSHVLLTGANGFIGVHITRALLQRGYAVTAVVRQESKTSQLRILFPDSIARSLLSFAYVPDVTQPGAFDAVLSSGKPFNAVIHASSPVSFKLKDVEKDLYRPAIDGTTELLRSIKANAPNVKRVVMTSSISAVVDQAKGLRPGYVYTDKDWNPLTREEGLNSIRAGYRVSKILAEKAAWDFIQTEQPNFALTTLCPPFVFGPAEQVTNVEHLNESIAQIYAAFTGEALAPLSGYVWVDVRDVALAHVLALESAAAANQRYIIAAGNYSPQQVINHMWEKYPKRAAEKNIAKGSPEEPWPEGGVFSVDISKSQLDLGLTYRPFEESIKDTLTRLLELEA